MSDAVLNQILIKIAMDYLECKINEAVEQNKNLKQIFAKLKKINQKSREEKSKILYHKIEMEKRQNFKSKLEKELKGFMTKNT